MTSEGGEVSHWTYNLLILTFKYNPPLQLEKRLKITISKYVIGQLEAHQM
jgi:hypothetical protein